GQFPALQIDHSHLTYCSKVDVHLFARTINGHGFRMVPGQRDISYMLEMLGVDNVELMLSLAAAFDVVVFVHRVENGAIDSIRQLDRIRDLVIFSAHQGHSAEIVAIGNDFGRVALVSGENYQITDTIKLPDGVDGAIFNPVNKYYYVESGGKTEHQLNIIHTNNSKHVAEIT